jgi:Flp pilus assembly protein TadG
MDNMKSEKGQAMVEFALVLPILLLLILGIIDFGRILYTKNALTALSQEAARHASIYYASEDDYALKQYVINNIGTLNSSNLTGDTITFTDSTGVISRNSGSDVKVTLTYSMYYITPIVNLIPGMQNPFNITSSATYRAE